MSTQLYANNASTTLFQALTNSATNLLIQPGDESMFPGFPGGLSLDEWFVVTVEDLITKDYEIVRVTAVAANNFTIVRAQEDTDPRNFAEGSKVELRVTRDTLNLLRDLATAATASWVEEVETPVSTWVIEHNLNKFPNVTLIDNAGNLMLAEMVYNDANTITVNFSAPVAGYAYVS